MFSTRSEVATTAQLCYAKERLEIAKKKIKDCYDKQIHIPNVKVDLVL
jgi:hypothetical protein